MSTKKSRTPKREISFTIKVTTRLPGRGAESIKPEEAIAAFRNMIDGAAYPYTQMPTIKLAYQQKWAQDAARKAARDIRSHRASLSASEEE